MTRDSAQSSKANGTIHDGRDQQPNGTMSFPQLRIPPDFMPKGAKSLARISEHGLGLGIVLSLSTILAGQLAWIEHYLWRLPFFIATLSLFHFLEFDMTARYNPTDAKVSSYLLFTNGQGYNIAHATAMLEITARYFLTHRGYLNLQFVSQDFSRMTVVMGLFLVVLGQLFRSLAMKQAGTSFNHLVQTTKKEDHVLVTRGVYAISRHPSYFGFFWWGVGTQILLGNPFCFLAYFSILWKFFNHRIRVEEKHLVTFFDERYLAYRKATRTLIPFIR